MNPDRKEFTQLFERADDPWGFKTRWYEARKRDLTVASLPRQRYRRAYEPGCANGELAAALAPRCAELLVSDGVPAALERARQRLEGSANIRFLQGWVPDNWPTGSFDLIVFSEIGFYLDHGQLAKLIDQMKAALEPDGTLLACHWRHPVEGYALNGDDVHRALAAQLGWLRLARHEEADFLLEVWSPDPRSVAQLEGFVDS
ncbi:class I SAM-dependent methyltransferase [Polaromonas sp. CG_23.6]|uniref:class I SAM-dependent DNA methyltransferase n=1 Tax=unclassified Polaromonas TaxID=2638319 RepID=UPI0018CBEE4D|nr:SAM-dependent methyltransferase [Polaromonas sp. CG_23.6]MBG6072617.1 SAM-dependent methyltransferase [Polaromonas sp. CG_9.7]MBG6114663.1 SAM-dependent methyltransferase [Polaromonas sp. CG_9.2]MDH6185172.1 SAM-dependent methyltransferase [Polaromonas sp. CG_23.6]